MEIPTPEDLKNKKHNEGVGPFVAIIIIVALMAAGGIYLLVMKEIERQNSPSTQDQAQLR